MRALVTGGQGFVGRYLCAALLRDDPATQVFATGRSQAFPRSFSHALSVDVGVRAPLPDDLAAVLSDARFHYAPVSILDERSLARAMQDTQPDYIFHLASGLRGDADAALIETNVLGTATLMRAIAAAHLARTPRVVIGSTGGTYGRFSVDQLPLAETTPCAPADVYASTKLAAEHIARVIGLAHGIPVMIARIFNIVGPGQDERHVAGRFARELHMRRSTGDALNVGRLDTTRDFVDVRDVAAALLVLARCGMPDTIYNVASGVETTIQTVLDLLVRCCGYSGACHRVETRERVGDVPRHWADISALRALGFTPQISLSQSLSDLFCYYDALQTPSQTCTE